MYTAEPSQFRPNAWDILDPDGDLLFTVNSRGEATTALSHLNR